MSMLCDPTFVIFSTSDGQSLQVNKYFLQIYNVFYNDIIKSHDDGMHQLSFIHEGILFNDLEQLTLDIHTKHENCGAMESKSGKCDKNRKDVVKEFSEAPPKVEKIEIVINPKDGHNDNRKEDNLSCPFHCSDSDKEWTVDSLFAHLHIIHYNEVETNISVSIETFLDKLKRKISNICALGCGNHTRKMLHSHYKTKHVENPIVCDHCGQTYQNKYKLKDHSRVCDKTKPVVCETCSKVCRNPYALKRHIHSVHEERKFPCTNQNCTQIFPNEQERKQHLQIVHEKLKPFKCDICGVSMAQFTNLKDHRGKVHHMEKYKSIHQYREIISSGNHPFIEKDSPIAHSKFL